MSMGQWEDLEDLDVATTSLRSEAMFGCVVERVVLEKRFHFMRTLYQEGPTYNVPGLRWCPEV